MNKHLAKAKDYIGKGEGFYRKAAEEIEAAKAEGVTTAAISRELGFSRAWITELVAWSTECRDTDRRTPWAGPRGEKREASTARKVLSEPEQRRRVLAELPESQLSDLAGEATDTLVGRARAKRAERQTEPTAGELMGGENWDPSESWADNQIIALNHKARSLAAHVEKWGPVLGSMPEDMAFEYLQEAEKLIAEVRVVWQSRLREGATA